MLYYKLVYGGTSFVLLIHPIMLLSAINIILAYKLKLFKMGFKAINYFYLIKKRDMRYKICYMRLYKIHEKTCKYKLN